MAQSPSLMVDPHLKDIWGFVPLTLQHPGCFANCLFSLKLRFWLPADSPKTSEANTCGQASERTPKAD